MDKETAIKTIEKGIRIAEAAESGWVWITIEQARGVLDLINYQHEHIEALLRDQEPRLLKLEEVVDHYSLPPVCVDDLNAQEDYMQDITPLYFDFPSDDSWAVHWRGYQSIRKYLDDWKASYGKNWRCWTAKPTEEQRKAVKWNDI